jgi:hypothetical protein
MIMSHKDLFEKVVRQLCKFSHSTRYTVHRVRTQANPNKKWYKKRVRRKAVMTIPFYQRKENLTGRELLIA